MHKQARQGRRRRSAADKDNSKRSGLLSEEATQRLYGRAVQVRKARREQDQRNVTAAEFQPAEGRALVQLQRELDRMPLALLLHCAATVGVSQATVEDATQAGEPGGRN
eukprot:COSAG05_NODE_15700_length_363_cov_1.371212_1_plen_108_part_01